MSTSVARPSPQLGRNLVSAARALNDLRNFNRNYFTNGSQTNADSSTNQQQTSSSSSNQQQTTSVPTNQQRTATSSSNKQQTTSATTNQQQTASSSSNQQQTPASATNQQQVASSSSNQQQITSSATNQTSSIPNILQNILSNTAQVIAPSVIDVNQLLPPPTRHVFNDKSGNCNLRKQ